MQGRDELLFLISRKDAKEREVSEQIDSFLDATGVTFLRLIYNESWKLFREMIFLGFFFKINEYIVIIIYFLCNFGIRFQICIK